MKKGYGIDCISPEVVRTITKRAMDLHEELSNKLASGEMSEDDIPVQISQMQKDAFRRIWDQGNLAAAEYVISSMMAEMFMGLASTSMLLNPLSNAAKSGVPGVIDKIKNSPHGVRDFLSEEEKAMSENCFKQIRSLEAVLMVVANLVSGEAGEDEEDTEPADSTDEIVVDFATAKKDRGMLH